MKKKEILIISAIFTLGICAVMNFWLIPAIQNAADGMTIFDMCSLGYKFETAKLFVSSLSAEGLNTYLHRQLPLDFVYPVVYTVFFVTALITLAPKKKILLVFPALLMISDYTENILTIKMLTTDFKSGLASFASCVTTTKSMLMYLIFVIIIVLFVIYLVKRKKNKA